MSDPDELIWQVYDGLPRAAPGSVETAALLLRLVGELPEEPTVLDVGSGPGAATVPLAQLTGGTVTAVDLHEPLLAEVQRRAAEVGVTERVKTLAASMDAMPIPAGSVDLLWSEGAAYIIGFDTALATWRPLLADDGVVVVTEAEWMTSEPAAAVRDYWNAGYPAMRTTAQNVAAIADAGWTLCATYVLPKADWATYYGPLRTRLDDLTRSGVPAESLAPFREEIAMWERHGDEFGYTAYVLRPATVVTQ
ncbi:cyclopropane-fatty-acyl-phospholipid synthase family protein [Gordonia sp. ABSL49_1]|uniref:SAM-dependent methyltransferase n=1 Tax=Gordonia sp. ABSL49_1 TaxID=2920941 RepID=UPI001F118C12|nr:class I SAM-dependent methyltransferase [Gordonia sp. ABSL49_1]MCH5644394.1 methyltransferase domain-containing protein [Gordonia sp. ABSL49_1]